MTNNEKELLNIIHQHSNPEQALKAALDLAMVFLMNCGVPQDTSAALPQEAS
jgi:hypothetical protein